MRRASAVRYGWEKLYIRRGRQKIQTEDTVGKIDYERFTICFISRLRGFHQTMSKLEMTVFDGDFFYTTASKEVIFFGKWKVIGNCRIQCAILKWNKGGLVSS